LESDILREKNPTVASVASMAKGPGVSATSRIIAQSQTNIHYYSDPSGRLQQNFYWFSCVVMRCALCCRDSLCAVVASGESLRIKGAIFAFKVGLCGDFTHKGF